MDNTLDSYDDFMDINHSISASTSLHTPRPAIPDVYRCKNLLDGIQFILYNNITQKDNNAVLTEDQEQMFEVIEQLRKDPQNMFMHLQNYFARHFDVGLYIVAFDNGKFSLIKKDNCNKKYKAFLSFNEDNTVRGPLYTINVDGTTETVFAMDNGDIDIHVYMYVAQLDHIKSTSGFPQIQEQQGVHCEQELRENLLPDNNSLSTNEFTISDPPIQIDNKTQSRIVLHQVLQQIFRIFDGLPVDPCTMCHVLQPFLSNIIAVQYLSCQDTLMASKDGVNCLSYLIQLAEQSVLSYGNIGHEQVNMFQSSLLNVVNAQDVQIQNGADQISSNTENLINTDAVTTIATNTKNSVFEELTDIVEKYRPPTLRKLLEKTIHPRTFKEFAQTGSNPVQCINSSQRDPIPIGGVSLTDDTELYLGIGIVDIFGQTHRSKVIVPEKTKVENELLMNNNDLKCLNFDECDENYKFDRDTKDLYLKISTTERQVQQKEIRIHMIKFYQRGEITKNLIQERDLKKCKLAFCFCTCENGEYKRVSSICYSDIIEDTMKGTNKNKKTIKKNSKRLLKKSIDVH